MKPAAAVDVGSNTVRLLIAEPDRSANLKIIRLERHVTRLSQNLEPGGKLYPEAGQRTLEALSGFGRLVREHGVERVFGGATAACRLACDGLEFLARVKAETGLEIRRLTGEQEAHLTALGMLGGLASVGPLQGPVLAVDPGGQSTEFIPVTDGDIGQGVSLNIGVVGLTERHLFSDPPSSNQMASLKAAVREKLAEVKELFPPREGLRLIGTAGTVTTIGAMVIGMRDYDPGRVTGLSLTAEKVDQLRDELAALPMAMRVGLPGLEPGREDVIIPGLVLVGELIKLYGLMEMLVIDAGLLEGLILEGVGREKSPAA